MNRLKALIPAWASEWIDIIIPAAQIALVLLLAIVLHYGTRKLINRVAKHYAWPLELIVPVKGLIRWLIIGGAILLILERLGVSATVLWTAFSGFAAVGAVAFFAAWSVLSNFFCAVLIFTVRPYRLGDYIEVLDALDKPGAKGRVIDINMLYTTLEDFDAKQSANIVLQIPNTHIFQKVVRRWTGMPPQPDATPPAPSDAPAGATLPPAA
ncbi:MAG: mechanosensitive ion channel family protein [Comamonas sp.]